jgi:hypothetical protein
VLLPDHLAQGLGAQALGQRLMGGSDVLGHAELCSRPGSR